MPRRNPERLPSERGATGEEGFAGAALLGIVGQKSRVTRGLVITALQERHLRRREACAARGPLLCTEQTALRCRRQLA
jgi:hypothetical protein